MDPAAVLIFVLGGLTLLLSGVVLVWVLRIVSGPRELSSGEPEVTLLIVAGWTLLVGGLGAAAVIACLVVMGPLAVIGVPACLFVLLMAFFRLRRARQHMLLSSLAVAAERLMPLAPVIDAFAEERWGLMRIRARRLAALVRAGLSLPEALARTPGLVSYQAQVTIRVGQESGSLGKALRDVVRSHELNETVWNQAMGRALYLGCVIVFGFGAVMPFMLLKIAPEFRKIFEEFDAELPAITQVLIGASNAFAMYWWLFSPLLLLLILMFVLVIVQYVVGVRWSIPLLNRFTRRLDTAVILDALALTAERRIAFSTGIETLAKWYPRGWIRRRLQAVLADIKSGIDWSHSLARRRLIKPVELAVFQASGRAGNLAWSLREMADSNRRRLNYRLYLMVQTLFPVAVVALAFLVMVFVMSYLLPLISLIQNLT